MIILAMLIFTVIFVVGVIALDVGFWLTERRGAQTDADLTATGGAFEYMRKLSAPDTSAAFLRAIDYAVKNGTEPSEIDGSPTSTCSDGNSCINVGVGDCFEDGTDTDTPWVEAKIRHDGPAFFSSIFGVLEQDIGAVARACLVSIESLKELSPFGVQTNFAPAVGAPETGSQCGNNLDDDADGTIDDGCPLSSCMEPDPEDPSRTQPIYGRVCILKTGAQDSVGGQRGQLTIGSSSCDQASANTLKHDFHYNTPAECTVGQTIQTGSGNIIGLLQGLNERLLEEGRCDQLFGSGHAGYDDFDEVYTLLGSQPGDPIVPDADNVFIEQSCAITSGQGGIAPDPAGHVHTYTPRSINLVLIDQLTQGSNTTTITGFAVFYVIGCFPDAIALQTKQLIEANIVNVDPFLNRCDNPTGQEDILGVFIRALKTSGSAGGLSDRLPIAVVLVK